MGIKVQNSILELKIPSYENNEDKLVKVKSSTELEYVDNSELYSSINHSDMNVGLELSNYLNNLIISSGYFYDEETNKIYNFDKPTTLTIINEPINYNDMTASKYKDNVQYNGALYHNNHVLSNFSSTNYAYVETPFLPEDKNWEMMFKVKTNPTLSTGQFLGGVDAQEEGIEAGIADSKFVWWLGTTAGSYNIQSGVRSSYTVLGNTTYWIRLSFNGSRYDFDYSLDGIDFQNAITVESTQLILGHTKSLGVDMFGKSSPFGGSIDLSETYFKIDNEYIWRGIIPLYDYGVYYIFSTNEFIYSREIPNERHRLIGRFNLDNNKIKSLFPTKDLASSFENNFIIAEQLGTTGYRIYSDGYKEQWGNGTNPTFPVAFDNIPTNVTAGATNVTETGMTLAAGYWQAEGY